MSRIKPNSLILIVFIVTVSLIYLAGINRVPFHPDESTYIYMSSDFETFFSHPSELFWQPESADAIKQRYRLLDAPILRNVIGFALWLTGQPPLLVDWDWSKTWQENETAGALPDARLLHTGRRAVAWLFPLTLLFIYLAGKQLGGETVAWASMLLALSSALLLLHTRRSMAEGWLVFGVALSLWALLTWRKHPWLCAIPIALAFNAKYSAAPLVLVGLIAIWWNSSRSSHPWRTVLRQTAGFLAIFSGLTLLFNPFLWAHPFQALANAVRVRTEFMAAQAADFSSAGNIFSPLNLIQSKTAMLANLFYTPPAFAEVSNYLAQTQASVNAYLSNPFHKLMRGAIGGAFQFGLTLLGLIALIRMALTAGSMDIKVRSFIFLAALFIESFVLLISTRVAFQRYYLVLLPMVFILGGFGIASLINLIMLIINRVSARNQSQAN